MLFSEFEETYKSMVIEGFGVFAEYLKNSVRNGQCTGLELQHYLDRLITSHTSVLRNICACGLELTVEQKREVTYAGRLVACSMLVLCDGHAFRELRIKALLLMEYASYLGLWHHHFGTAVVRCFSWPMIGTGFSWTEVIESDTLQLIIYKLIEKASFDKKNPFQKLSLERAGSVVIDNGVLRISSAPLIEASVKSMEILGSSIEVCTRNSRDEKIKAAGMEDVQTLEDFAKTFIGIQDASLRSCMFRNRGALTQGKEYTVMLTSISYNSDNDCDLICVPLGVDCYDSCLIRNEELVKGIYTKDIAEYFCENDCIEGAVLVDFTSVPVFSIRNAYIRYSEAEAEKDAAAARVYQAKVVDIYRGRTSDKDRLRMLSANGYGGLVKELGDAKVGDILTAKTEFSQKNGCDLFINMSIIPEPYHLNVDKFDEESVLENFVITREMAMLRLEEKGSKEDSESMSRELSLILSIGRILPAIKTNSSIAKYYNMLVSAFIANFVGDQQWLDLVISKSDFLHQCLRVAEGVPVRRLSDDGLFTEMERKIVDILGLLDYPERISDVAVMLQESSRFGGSVMDVARLVTAFSLASSLQGLPGVKPSDIRRRICKCLNVSDHCKQRDSKGGGKYGKGELADVEFKASYVISNKTGKPDLEYQAHQVFEAVCGFLNKDGGTVYIGVNNYGDPLWDGGNDKNDDLKWFASNISALKRKRWRQLGHSVPEPVDLDSFCLFLNDEKELYFKPTVLSNITITPTDDYDAIRIEVKPSEFEIVKLYSDNTWSNGIAYVRNGEETGPMTGHEQRRRLMKLRSVGKVEDFIIILSDAIDTKRKVLLKNYSSSNSNVSSDRLVVPVNLVYNNEILWAYDLDIKDFREFRLSRIDSIVQVDGAPYPHNFHKGEADIFRWINPGKNFHIKLKMTRAALNCLKEEYSVTRSLPSEELYKEGDNHWILDTILHGLEAVCRFYVGLADQVEILDTEDADCLRKYVREFLARINTL